MANMQINVTSAKGVLLKTEGKLCENNIAVVPELEELTITENGEYTPSKAGYSKVNVNVASSGGGDDVTKYFEERYAEVNLPNATKIKPYAFYNDTTITDISMPNVTYIGKNAFDSCTKLALTSLPNGIVTIDQSAFSNCNKLALTSLPTELYGIEQKAFYNCALLEISTFPDALHYIQVNGFYGCSKLETLLFQSVVSINNTAFSKCSSLKEITFRETASYISSSAFSNCTNLATINVPWAEGAVSNAPWGAPSGAVIRYNFPGTITFSIDGTVYTAEKGMTWYDWCLSDYNTSPFYCEADTGAVNNTGEYFVAADGTPSTQVFGDTIIEEGNAYISYFEE